MPADLSQIESRFEVHVSEHPADLGQLLNRARMDKEHCDFLIKVGSKKVHAHKNVLSVMSEYFKGMLYSGMKEATSGVVEMEEIDPDCLETCIEYMYTGRVSTPGVRVEQLLHAADLLQIPKLCEEIALFLQRNLNSNLFFPIWQVANTYDPKGLKDGCERFAKDDFVSISQMNEFKNLKEDFIARLIKAKDTKASEAEKCQALLFWSTADAAARKETFESVFLNLNLRKLPTSYKLYLSKNEGLVSESAKCLRELFQSQVGTVVAKAFRAGGGDPSHNAVAVFDRTSMSFQAFTPENKSWKKLADASDEFHKKEFCALLVDETIIVISISDKTNYKFHLADRYPFWTKLPDRSEKNPVQAVAAKGEVYVFDNYNKYSKCIEKLQLDHSDWCVKSKEEPCHEEAIIQLGDCIYTFGGYDGAYIARAMKFDPSADSWTKMKTAMPTARYQSAAAGLGNKVFVIGGYSKDGPSNAVECFNITSQTWTTVKNTNNCRYLFRACSVDWKIYVIGGIKSENTVEEYDVDEDTWTTVSVMHGMEILNFATFSVLAQQ